VSATRNIYRQFAAAAVDSRHLINESDSDPGDTSRTDQWI